MKETQAVVQSGSVQEAPPANPAGATYSCLVLDLTPPAALPGAVGNIPYVYNDKQFLPSKASSTGYPIVWVFADNKTPDKLYFGFQSSDGVMHVYNEIKPNGVTRQQAFGTLLLLLVLLLSLILLLSLLLSLLSLLLTLLVLHIPFSRSLSDVTLLFLRAPELHLCSKRVLDDLGC
eukprot:764518-Hanusia_phi.AAC.4